MPSEDSLEKLLKSLANAERIAVIRVLSRGGKSYSEIIESLADLGFKIGNLTYHLKKLVSAKVIYLDSGRGIYALTPLGREIVKTLDMIEFKTKSAHTKFFVDPVANFAAPLDEKSLSDEISSVGFSKRKSRIVARDILVLLDERIEQDVLVRNCLDQFLYAKLKEYGYDSVAETFKVYGVSRNAIEDALNRSFDSLSNISVSVLENFVYDKILNQKYLKLYMNGIIYLNNPSMLIVSPQAILVSLEELAKENPSTELSSRIIILLLEAGLGKVAHVTVDNLSKVLAVSSDHVWLLNTIIQLNRIIRKLGVTQSITFMLDCEDLFNDYVSKCLIDLCSLVKKLKGLPNFVISIRYKSNNCFIKSFNLIYNLVKNYLPITFVKTDTNEIVYGGVLLTSSKYPLITSFSINLFNIGLITSFKESRLIEQMYDVCEAINDVMNTQRIKKLSDHPRLNISFNGLGPLLGALGFSTANEKEYVQNGLKLINRLKSIVADSIAPGINVITSTSSLDQKVYETLDLATRGGHQYRKTKLVSAMAKAFNLTSVLPYNIDIELQKRVSLEAKFQSKLPGAGLLNIHLKDPFVEPDRFYRLLKYIATSGIRHVTITRDYTVCIRCGSLISDIRSSCSKCSFLTMAETHYGKILGYYENLSGLSSRAREEYYSRHRYSLF